ncbi:uncharacterized protein LOC128982936 [Macrosteles quadrilineatus]|uniref:uncharacterized protein LOC128982936 n=1 Tax=Macrosteles quadrilineatus TaxID=74068 RepID=UPI0023E2DE89|nr:uncharacterized protein LOC128982936 [Macrosteles quadrilineatus]
MPFPVNRSKYIFKSSKCKILNLNPFDISIIKFVQKSERSVCAVHPPLTTVTFNSSTEKHVLEVNKSAIQYYTNSSRIQCCVKRLKEDILRLFFSPCRLFHNVFEMDSESQFIFVFCLDDNKTIVYQNMHAGVVKVDRFTEDRKRDPNSLNVILLGIDSMSRLNFYRTMPKTVSYLHTHGWVEMKGYNKVADNTLPNMMAFLSGLPLNILRRSQTLDFDNMPFIWKEFSKAGYVTAYAEDQPLVSTFHCHLNGFKRLPTDHYFRDYIYVGEMLLMGRGRPPGCIGYKLASEHLFDYLVDFVTVYKKDPFFGLFWLNQISHNDLNRASGEDDTVLQLMSRLVETGVMNTTMVALLSDHGLRVGDFRRSIHGWYEDRLPLLFISVPEWYKTQNEVHFSSLLLNSGRLTSPYDLYLTMKYVLYGRRSTVAAGCKSCFSLFSPVPADRSCAEAGISSHWCTCFPTFDVPHDPSLALSVVDAINGKLTLDPDINPLFRCAELKLKKVMYVRRKCGLIFRELVVGVATEPGGAEFEATVTEMDSGVTVEDSISRLNSYGNESSCAYNPTTKLFCHCQSRHPETVKSDTVNLETHTL